VVLYGYETWSLTIREKHRLRVFENRVLRRIFGPKRDGVMGDWKELHNLYSSSSIIIMIKLRRIRRAGHVARMGEKRNAYRILMGRPEGKRQRRRWMDNIKTDLKAIGWGDMEWIGLTG
jgi:hypothetical protein